MPRCALTINVQSLGFARSLPNEGDPNNDTNGAVISVGGTTASNGVDVTYTAAGGPLFFGGNERPLVGRVQVAARNAGIAAGTLGLGYNLYNACGGLMLLMALASTLVVALRTRRTA